MVFEVCFLCVSHQKILSFARDICKEAQIFDMESFSDDVKRANQLGKLILCFSYYDSYLRASFLLQKLCNI